ncbi:4Fe-4S binding protein, partial [Acinetobacter baumannii]
SPHRTMLSPEYLTLYATAAAVAVSVHLVLQGRKRRADAQTFEEAKQAGLNEPASLHPVVDPNRCFGSGACVKACPEEALGIVHGKATLVNA